MIWLLLRVLLSVTFSQGIRYLQVRTDRTQPALLLNYVVAGFGSAAMALALGGIRLPPSMLALAAIGGITYVTSLVLLLPAMREVGVAVTGAVLQLALMVPVSLAIVRYGETPTLYHAAGILLTLIALPLLSAGSAGGSDARRVRLSPSLILLFLSGGASQSVMKEATLGGGGPAQRLGFMTGLFAFASVATAVWMLLQRPSPALRAPRSGFPVPEWPLGVGLGLANAAQLVCLLLALEALPALIVFPASSTLGLTANVVASLLLWRERPTRAAWLGMALATAAVLLLNA
jgi:drug/metabolite transporter (DMT)-like permease